MDYELLKADLCRDEGIRHVPYDDPTGEPLKKGDVIEGNITIGVGRNLHEPLSADAVMFLLGESIRTVEEDFDRNIPWWRDLPEPVQRGLANMGFIGWPALSTFKRMLAALAKRDYPQAAIEALDSVWARQVGARADRIAKLFRQGENP